MRACSPLSAVAAVALSALVVVPAGPAVAAASTAATTSGRAMASAGPTPAPGVVSGCPRDEETHVRYVKGSTRRTAVGSVVGGYNASPHSDMTIKRTLTATRTKRSAWEVGGEASVGWGILQVKGHVNRTAEVSSTRGESVEVTLAIPPKHYGYLVPKVQTKAYRIYITWISPDCKGRRKNYGTIRAVVASLDFGSCVTRKRSGCRP